MGFDEGRLEFDRGDLLYNAGDVVRAKVVFNQEKNKTFRGMYAKIKGYCDVHWTTRHSRRRNDRTEHYTIEHTSHEEYFEHKIYLMGGKSGEVHLNPGLHECPFEFLIPPHCPSSFEGSNGHIRYEVKVVIDRSFKFDQEKLMNIRVQNLKDLNRNPYCKDPMQFEFEDTYCCWCMSQGLCEVKAKLPQSGYCPGQTINIELNCANKSNVEIDAIKFEVIETRKFIATHNSDTRYEENVIASLKKGSIPGNTTRNWTLEMDIPQMEVYNLDSCQYIDIYHDFKVVVSPSGCHSDTEGTRRLIIGHVPLREFEGPPLGEQVVAPQPVAPSMTQYPGNQQYPGVQPYTDNPYPGANPTFPTNPPYVVNPPYPGSNPPYPGSNPPYPGSNPPYPGSNPPYPGSNPPYPGANPPYPGPTPYPSALPGPSPYPVGEDPKPAQPGFVTNQVPLPYPSSQPIVNAYAAASAPPPGTPDYDGSNDLKSILKKNAFIRNLICKGNGNASSQCRKNHLYFYYYNFKEVKQYKLPLKKLTNTLASGKLPKLSDIIEVNKQKHDIFQSRSNVNANLTAPKPPDVLSERTSHAPFSQPILSPLTPLSELGRIPLSNSVPATEPPPYSESAPLCPSYSESVSLNKPRKEELKALTKENIESNDVLEGTSKMFLFSLLPDLNSMTDVQLRAFKKRAIDLVDNILEKNPSTSVNGPNELNQDISVSDDTTENNAE